MANLPYRLIQRTPTLGENKGNKVFTAQPVNHGKISFDDFCKEVSDGSTVDVADVKAVLSRLHVVIPRLIERGFSVDCGDLGTFRAAFGSKGVLKEEDFNTNLISSPRVVFTPRVAFKNSLKSAGFERTYPKSVKIKVTKPSGGTPTPSAPSGTPTTGHSI